MNIENLRKTRDAIAAAGGDKFCMEHWLAVRIPEVDPLTGSNWKNAVTDPVELGQCGTAGCVAGWAAHCAAQESNVIARSMSVPGLAQEWLDLTDHEADYLFYGFWRTTECLMDVTADMAVEYLDRLIAGEKIPEPEED